MLNPLLDEERESEQTFSPRTSFTADSPYYTSYVETEMRQVHVLSQTLQDISARAKTFGKCGALMAEATRRLALACRLKQSNPVPTEDDDGKSTMEPQDKVVKERQEAVGEEMMVVLSTLGEVLDEIANAQVQMCENLEASLSHSLEAFRGTQVSEVTALQSEADQMTESAEQSFSKYLNGRQYASDDNVGSWNKLSEQVSSGFSKTWRESADLSRFRRGNSNAGSKDKRDPSLVMATTAANLRLTLEQIRLAQTSAELKRFQLLQKLVSIKKRRNFELGESALASLHGIGAYFHQCSDLVQGLSPRMTRFQELQKESREKHVISVRPWKAREQGLFETMDQVGQSVAQAASLADMMANGEIAATAEAVSLQMLEEETQIWDLPTLLAESSRYQREPAPGVLVEGWLYKKASSRMSLQQWQKRWFMMDKDGIYYFRSSAETKKSEGGYLHTLERVKICDMVLCTVREVAADGLRFSFEVITPNQKPLLLQTRGPQEYKMWVEGIRTSIETQFFSGTVDAGQLMKGIGKQTKKKKQGSSGLADTVTTLASMLESETVTNRSSDCNKSDDEDGDDDDNEWRDASAEADFKNSQRGRGNLSGTPQNPLAQDIMIANPVCADCGTENPDWASLNLGVLLCIECSGVHRSLGVHLSKVRSLKLDSLSDSECRLLLAMGNARANTIWEAGIGLQQGWTKPEGDGGRQLKENWIKSKYQWKGFLEDCVKSKSSEEKALRYSMDLFEAARNANFLGVAEALAYGGDVHWKHPDEEGKTALHVCALSRPPTDGTPWVGIECAELLLQNGAKMDTMDDNTQGVLDCAVIGSGEREMVEFLSARIH